MIEYVIVGAENPDTLEEMVRSAITDGWEPLGGVACTGHFEQWENSRKGYMESETRYTWAQAMIKRPAPHPDAGKNDAISG